MSNKKIPQRMCVCCRKKTYKKELIRIVRTPEGDVIIDNTGKKSGRGAYLCGSLDCFEKACKTKILQRALDCDINEDVLQQIKRSYLNG